MKYYHGFLGIGTRTKVHLFWSRPEYALNSICGQSTWRGAEETAADVDCKKCLKEKARLDKGRE